MANPNKGIYSVVKQALDAYDPEQLLKMGCPSDEYHLEAVMIAEHIEDEMGLGPISVNKVPDGRVIWMICCVVLHLHFHSLSDPILYCPKHRELAEKIRAALLDLKGGYEFLSSCGV